MIDIPRAIAEDRKIRFSHCDNWRLYYDTVFGEQFAIPVWQASGIKRTALASDYQANMQYHNDSLGSND